MALSRTAWALRQGEGLYEGIWATAQPRPRDPPWAASSVSQEPRETLETTDSSPEGQQPDWGLTTSSGLGLEKEVVMKSRL